MNNKYKKSYGAGFSLIEALVASVIIGLAVVGLLLSSGSLTKVNAAGIEISTAEFLIEEVKSRCASMAYDDLPAVVGTYSPPQDIYGAALTNFSTFSQQVTVDNVSNSDFTVVVGPGSSDFVRITTKILVDGSEISSADWIRARL
jgi:type II secretory pathway pseudopilin PulG